MSDREIRKLVRDEIKNAIREAVKGEIGDVNQGDLPAHIRRIVKEEMARQSPPPSYYESSRDREPDMSYHN